MVAQVAADHVVHGAASLALLVASYAFGALFLLANRLLVGIGVMAVGLAANAVVVLANGGMPVRPSAIAGAGLAGRNGPAAPPTGAGHHLEASGDHLTFLDDHLALRPIHRVVSYGDILLAVGAVDVLVHLALEAWRPRRVGEEGDPQDPGAGDQPPGGGLVAAT